MEREQVKEELRKGTEDAPRTRGKQTAGAALCRFLDSFTSLREVIENCLNPQAAGGSA